MRIGGCVLLTALALAGCGSSAKKPSDADIAAYLGQSQPSYLRVGNVSPSFEVAKSSSGPALPEGSWRITIAYTLHATEDLYAAAADTRQQRLDFDRQVSKFEAFRANRIAYAEQVAQRAGLMKQGDPAPEPPVSVSVVTHSSQDLQDRVTLLAEPDGTGWKFFQTDAQALSDDQVGAPLATLKSGATHTHFVVGGTEEERSFHNSMLRYLAALARAPGP